MSFLGLYTLQGTDTYPTKREVRNIIIDSKVPASNRGSRVRVRSRGRFNNKKTKHQGVSLSICTSSGITRNLKSLYQRRCDPKIKQKKKTVPPSIPSPCSDLLALPPRLFHTSHLGNPFIRRPFWRSHLRRGLRQCHCSKPHGLLLRGGPLLVISRVMIPKNGLIMD